MHLQRRGGEVRESGYSGKGQGSGQEGVGGWGLKGSLSPEWGLVWEMCVRACVSFCNILLVLLLNCHVEVISSFNESLIHFSNF